MGHSEGQWQASIFIDTTAELRVAHAGHMRHAQGFTGLVPGRTQILPAKKEVVMGCLSPMPRRHGGGQATPQIMERRRSLLITLTSDPHNGHL